MLIEMVDREVGPILPAAAAVEAAARERANSRLAGRQKFTVGSSLTKNCNGREMFHRVETKVPNRGKLRRTLEGERRTLTEGLVRMAWTALPLCDAGALNFC